MADRKELLRQHDDTTISAFLSEDGRHFNATRTDMDPIMDRVAYLNEKVNGASRATNKQGYNYVGSVPRTMIDAWLKEHGYTWHDLAINAGGEKGKTTPGGPGVKDKFMGWFLHRDRSKLHTKHITSKQSDTGLIYTGD